MILDKINVSVQFVVIYVIERDILLIGDREKDMRIERNVFLRRLQRHNTTTSFFTTHTHTLTNTLTLTHTHMTGQPWLVGQVVPEEFFSGFCNSFLDQSGQQNFLAARGSCNIRKYFPQSV